MSWGGGGGFSACTNFFSPIAYAQILLCLSFTNLRELFHKKWYFVVLII